ncbi:BCCT family transporter [Mariniblastus fucicola]|nr:BCCT family transporter [Mariniblastus fucicola]
MSKEPPRPKLDSVALNHVVFWPPFLLLLFAVGLNFLSPDKVGDDGKIIPGGFSKVINGANGWILDHFSWLFSLCAFLALCLCIWICFSKFGKVRIGGSKAKPLMSMWNWFSITICTTIAIGILFWSTAEPVTHYVELPADIAQPRTPEAATFALSTMYLHWSFTPYALYCVASLMFAFAYYNMKKPFSLGSTLTPLFGDWSTGKGGNIIDAVCLYSLVAGMAAALGSGILMLSGGLTDVAGIPSNSAVWAGITFAIVATFIVSSATGLMNGIRILSDINTKLLMLLAVVALICGPTVWILTQSGAALVDYVVHFVPRNTQFFPENWGKNWTVFYWAVWLAWAPITACFLGRISYGRTVREFMLVNFIFPSLFAIVWMSIFSGTALYQEINGVDLYQFIDAEKEEAVSYAVFKQFPFSTAVVIFYMVSAFVCFVTSSDSNMSAMASISSSGISPENPEGQQWLKIVWGVAVGTVAWTMISFTGCTDGIKILSNLGGFPAAILELFIIGSLVRVVLFHEKLSVVE